MCLSPGLFDGVVVGGWGCEMVVDKVFVFRRTVWRVVLGVRGREVRLWKPYNDLVHGRAIMR